jgi:hypothetical protein
MISKVKGRSNEAGRELAELLAAWRTRPVSIGAVILGIAPAAPSSPSQGRSSSWGDWTRSTTAGSSAPAR